MVHGKAKSGKDTVANYIVGKVGAEKVWFAKPLKDMVKKHFKQTHDEVYEKKTKYSRMLLQTVGEMMRDEVNKCFWVHKVIAEIEQRLLSGSEHVVISDCRYKNEIIEPLAAFNILKMVSAVHVNFTNDEWIDYQKKYYGEENVDSISIRSAISPEAEMYSPCITIKVDRDGCPDIECGSSHSSENDLNGFKFDVVIENNSTLEELYKKVDVLLLSLNLFRV